MTIEAEDNESALLTAVLSGLDDSEPQWQQAQLTEAFGQHFLTDRHYLGRIVAAIAPAAGDAMAEIGRASCRERVWTVV